ncbi:MAG: hypothetical protein JWN37_628 [Candidatus Nomurabacteria bacterium]|nr:hypothetical protein [Candidatus Nomurabacteria bacterium]
MRTHRPYEIREYDPKWKDLFFEYAEAIRPIFGNNLIAIEHMGSTSIEGMVGKPQIDILVIVKDLSKVKEQYEEFRLAGFTPQGTEYVGIGDEYFTKDDLNGMRLAGVHTFQEGHPEIAETLLFRDYLRSNKEDRDLYIDTKRNLYAEHKDNYNGYDSGKKNIINEIKFRAKEWLKNI